MGEADLMQHPHWVACRPRLGSGPCVGYLFVSGCPVIATTTSASVSMWFSARIVVAQVLIFGAAAHGLVTPIAVACLQANVLQLALSSDGNLVKILGEDTTADAVADACDGYSFALVTQDADSRATVTCVDDLMLSDDVFIAYGGVSDFALTVDARYQIHLSGFSRAAHMNGVQEPLNGWISVPGWGKCLECGKAGKGMTLGSCGGVQSYAVFLMQQYSWPGENARNLQDGTYLPVAAGLEDWMPGVGELRCSEDGRLEFSDRTNDLKRPQGDLYSIASMACHWKHEQCNNQQMPDCDQKANICMRLALRFGNEGTALKADMCSDIRRETHRSLEIALLGLGEAFDWTPGGALALVDQLVDFHDLELFHLRSFVEVEWKPYFDNSQSWKIGALGRLMGILLVKACRERLSFEPLKARQLVPLGGALYNWTVPESLAFFDGMVAGLRRDPPTWAEDLEREIYQPDAIGPVADTYQLNLTERNQRRHCDLAAVGLFRSVRWVSVDGRVGGGRRSLQKHTLKIRIPAREMAQVQTDLPKGMTGTDGEPLSDAEWARVKRFAAAGLKLGYALLEIEGDWLLSGQKGRRAAENALLQPRESPI